MTGAMSKNKKVTEADPKLSSIQLGSVIGKTERYTIGEEIGRGGFGSIFSALTDKGVEVAVKVARDCRREYRLYRADALDSLLKNGEASNTSKKSSEKQEERMEKESSEKQEERMEKEDYIPLVCQEELRNEYYVLRHLEHLPGFPYPYELNVRGDETYLVMTRLGKSLGQLFEERKCTFSMGTILRIMDQMLVRLANLHEVGIVHGDLKPDNILVGVGADAGILHLIDFGLSTMYKDMDTGHHLPEQVNKHYRGTPRFMSIHAHNKIQQSRRDDMEGFGYVLAYFTGHGTLPWNEEEYLEENGEVLENILKIKNETRAESLFVGQPLEFAIFMESVWRMEYEDEPDYAEFRQMFRRLGYILEVDFNNGKLV